MGPGPRPDPGSALSLSPTILTAAIRDLHEAAKWYETQSEGLGRDLVQQVEQAIDSACLMPLRFPEVHRGIRRVLVKRFPFGVYFRYEEESNALIVFAIMHLRRDPKRWQERES